MKETLILSEYLEKFSTFSTAYYYYINYKGEIKHEIFY